MTPTAMAGRCSPRSRLYSERRAKNHTTPVHFCEYHRAKLLFKNVECVKKPPIFHRPTTLMPWALEHLDEVDAVRLRFDGGENAT
jgi:hypothetical protein